MPLGGDHIHGVDTRGAWCQGGPTWCYGIIPAKKQSCKRVVPRAIGQGRATRITSEGKRHTGHWIETWIGAVRDSPRYVDGRCLNGDAPGRCAARRLAV